MQSKSLEKIPRGNTCSGVNRTIIEYLLASERDFPGKNFLDIPCGAGDFLKAVRDFFPGSKTVGADINPPSKDFPHEFVRIDARDGVRIGAERKFDVITSISGVMEFDNTLFFFKQLKEYLNEKGFLVVTNDNLLSVRDRLLYVLFGRVKQYRLFIGNDEPTWKMIPLQNLLRILTEAGFERIEIKYVPVKPAEWLWLPAAVLIYIFQFLYLQLAETKVPTAEKHTLYPFSSLLSRHYVLICQIKR